MYVNVVTVTTIYLKDSDKFVQVREVRAVSAVFASVDEEVSHGK